MIAHSLELRVALIAFLAFSTCHNAANAQPGEDSREGPFPLPIKPLKVAGDDDEMQKLLKARFNELLTLTESVNHVRWKGRLTPAEMINPARELMQAGLAVYNRPEEKAAFLKDVLWLGEEIRKRIDPKDESFGVASRPRANAFVLEVQIELLKLKKAAAKEKK